MKRPFLPFCHFCSSLPQGNKPPRARARGKASERRDSASKGKLVHEFLFLWSWGRAGASPPHPSLVCCVCVSVPSVWCGFRVVGRLCRHCKQLCHTEATLERACGLSGDPIPKHHQISIPKQRGAWMICAIPLFSLLVLMDELYVLSKSV